MAAAGEINMVVTALQLSRHEAGRSAEIVGTDAVLCEDGETILMSLRFPDGAEESIQYKLDAPIDRDAFDAERSVASVMACCSRTMH